MKTGRKRLIAIGVATVVGGAVLAGAGYAAHRHGGGHGLGMHGFGKGPLALFAMDIFDSIDADGDGRLSQAEIDQVRNDRHAAHDANGDGSLVLEEFAGLWQETTHLLAVRAFQMLDAYVWHVSGGAIAGLILVWRLWHRTRRGVADAPAQSSIFNLAARLVHWGLLAAIVVVVVSGYLLPWTLGRELDVFGLGIPSPMEANRGLHELMEGVHDVSGHLFVPLLALHVLGAIKHIVLDRRGAGIRMFRPISGGR